MRAQEKRPPSGMPRLTHVAVADLIPNPSNPRIHKIAQVRALARSIEAFGFNTPILVDKRNQIVAGHGRWEAAKLLDLSAVPVIRLEHLTENQARAFMLADNKLAEKSDWDEGKLAIHLKELSELVLDFDLGATGFELPDIDLRIQSLDPPDVADKDDAFSVPAGAPVSRPGDLWLLGEHRLFCRSALAPSSYDAVLGDEVAAGVFADPPYNVRVDGHVGGAGKIRHREFAMASGEMSREKFAAFLEESLGLAVARSSPGAVIYTCMDWRHMAEMLAAGAAAGCCLINLCVWVKTNGGMGSFYRSRHELVFVFRNGDEQRVNNVQLGRFGRNRNNVWNYPGANSFARKGRVQGLDLHPTVKPVALVADAILDSTNRGDVVLDPFLGSGTTIMAAERTGRRCCGIELDPLYVDTAIRRWAGLTGKQAQRDSGLSFADLEIERRSQA
jgi:DNA modification methylase